MADNQNLDAMLTAASWDGIPGQQIREFLQSKLSELDASKIAGADFEPHEDGTKGTLNLLGADGSIITSVVIPMGTMSGEGTIRTILGVTTSTGKTVVRKGDSLGLSIAYDNKFAGGDNDGATTGYKATIQVVVKNGQTVKYSTTRKDVATGTSFDVTIPAEGFATGDNDVFVTAAVVDPIAGKTKTSTSYTLIKALEITLSTSFSMTEANRNGGFKPDEAVDIPYVVSGNGTKVVSLYIDGQLKASHTVTKQGTTLGQFAAKDYVKALGRHNVQLVATATEGGVPVSSQSIYFDIWRANAAGEAAPHVCLYIESPEGTIYNSINFSAPVLAAAQYEAKSVRYTAYTPANSNSSLIITTAGEALALSPDRTEQEHAMRFTTTGKKSVVITIPNGDDVVFSVDVAKSSIDVTEQIMGLAFKLDATGRSNSESNPAQWVTQDRNGNAITSSFSNALFGQMDGWRDNALSLINGASLEIGFTPFATDIRTTGMTIEATIKVSSVIDPSLPVLSCLDGGKGISVTGDEAAFITGETVTFTDEEGNNASRAMKISSFFPCDEWMKVAFVFHPSATGRLMELYINGNRVSADVYGSVYSFVQSVPAKLRFTTDGADVAIRNVRVYNLAMTDDACVDNYIADIPTYEDMRSAYTDNKVLNANGNVDLTEILSRGGGIVKVVRSQKLTDIYLKNDKKAKFYGDVYFYSPFGAEHNFVIHGALIQIQGTSSVIYDSKNLRIFLSTGDDTLSFECASANNDPTQWALRPGGIPVELICLKSDYVDSSMSSNTGGARIFHNTMLKLGHMTPAQRHQYEQGGNNINAVTYRWAIDGYPIDLFVAETADGDAEYMGTYNMNHEKKASGKIWGLTGVEGFTPAVPLALEALNNGAKGCLFQSVSDEDAIANFDESFEVTFGKDASGKEKEDTKWTGLFAEGKTAYLRLMKFIRECVPSGADPDDISTFASEKFRQEAGNYFDVAQITAAYLLTWRDAGVDQLAKNIIWTTWDGIKWHYIYYDGDTRLGRRNDAFLKYLYNVMRDSWDAEASKYVFEGHDSWLWNLLLANFNDVLKQQAERIATALTAEQALDVYVGDFTKHFSDRQLNRSGYLKYIARTLDGTSKFIYALSGNNIAHRKHFITNRYKLFNALYETPAHTEDSVPFYLTRNAGEHAPDKARIVASDIYTFGYGTNNSPYIGRTGLVEKGATATLIVGGTYTNNDPLRLYGASRMRSLDLTGGMSSHLSGGLDLSKCTSLQSLNLSLADGEAVPSSMFITLGNCRSLRTVNLRNQKNVRTASGSSAVDLSNLSRLEALDMRGCDNVSAAIIADGAPVTSLQLPKGLQILTLRNLRKLTSENLSFEGYSKFTDVEITGCPGIDSQAVAMMILSKSAGLRSLKCHGINWQGVSLANALKLADIKADIKGTIRILSSEVVSYKDKLRMLAAWGDIDTGANGLRVTYTTNDGLTRLDVYGPSNTPEVGDYKFGVIFTPSNFNQFKSVEWSIDDREYATIAKDGTLTVKQLGMEADAPKAIITATVTKLDGTTATATREVGFYNRAPKPGDKVYSDGTYSETLDLSKKLIGLCFWVDKDNPNVPGHRLMLGVDNLGTMEWGVQYATTLQLSTGAYNAKDVKDLSNIWGNSGSISESNYRTSANADGFIKFDEYSVQGQLGMKALNGAFDATCGPIATDTLVPYGKYNTIQIIRHRDFILNGLSKTVPSYPNSDGLSILNHLRQLLTIVAREGSQYRQLYYPAASYCYHYEPAVEEGVELADRFKAGNWWLPSSGELLRFAWYYKFTSAFNDAKSLLLSIGNYHWSSTEYNNVDYAWYVVPSSGDFYSNFKNNGNCVVRPAAAF